MRLHELIASPAPHHKVLTRLAFDGQAPALRKEKAKAVAILLLYTGCLTRPSTDSIAHSLCRLYARVAVLSQWTLGIHYLYAASPWRLSMESLRGEALLIYRDQFYKRSLPRLSKTLSIGERLETIYRDSL